MSARTGSIQQFLLIYDRKRDELLSHESFGDDAVAATTAYRAAEIEYQDRPEMDIVLVGADHWRRLKSRTAPTSTGSAARLLDEIRAGVS